MKMHQKVMIAAAGWLCVATAVQADTVTWIGMGSGQWTNAANWDVRVPLAGDDVTLAVNGAEIVLAETTPQLGSITLSGGATLVFTNWTTALQADAVTIGNLGIVTCAGPFTDAGPTNRVWIQATEVEIAAGGKIDVTARGFAAQNGPGKGYDSYWGPSGGSHGGMGGNQLAIIRSATLFYDAVQTPSLPGSGGGNSGASESVIGGAGGGAVYIDADTVTVNGAVLAAGESGASGTTSVVAVAASGSTAKRSRARVDRFPCVAGERRNRPLWPEQGAVGDSPSITIRSRRRCCRDRRWRWMPARVRNTPT